MKKSHLSVRDGTELLKKKCTRDLLCKITLSTSRFYQKILASYNNTKNRSIGMTPNQARKPENYGKVYFTLYGDLSESHASQKPTFKIGDTVRISKYKRKTFDKGYTPNWTEEVFVISEIQPTDPITYKIKDLNGEEIKGTFYREELQKTDQNYFIE